MESLVIAIKKGYMISKVFAHVPDVRRGVAPPCVECVTYLRHGDQVCDWYVPFMSTYPVFQALKSNRNPWNEASLVNYWSAGDICEEHENRLIWYRCDGHGICSAVSQILK